MMSLLLVTHQPHHWSCQGYRPNGLCQRGWILAWLPTPKPSCRDHRSQLQLYHLGRAPRSKGQRSGCGAFTGRIQLPAPSLALCWGKGLWGWALPPAEAEPFPTYCFILGPADKYSSIPRGGREVPNNGPAGWQPCCAVCPPWGWGAASVPPLRG